MKVRVLRRNRLRHQRALTRSGTWVLGPLWFEKIRMDLLPKQDTELRDRTCLVWENYPIAEAA